MKAQFNSINLSNQSIKLYVDLLDKISHKKGLTDYIYNKIVIFKYSINIIKSQFILNIYTDASKKKPFL